MLKPFIRLLDLIKVEKKEITSIYFYAILSGIISLILPLGIQAIVGFVLGATMVTSIFVLIFIVVFAVLISGILQINQMRIIEKVQQKIFVKNAFLFTEVIPKVDLQTIDKYYMPEKVNRFFDTINVQKGISKLLLEIPTASIQIIFGLLLLSFYHPIFIAFDLILVFILWLIFRFTSKIGLETSIAESNYKYKVVSWLEEMARVLKSFKFSQGAHLNLTKTDANLVNYLEARTNHFKVLLLQYKTLIFFKVAITAVMLFVGTSLLLKQELNIGEFIAAEIVILTVIAAIEKLIGSIDSVYDVITGLEKLASVTELSPEKDGNIQLLKTNEGLSINASNVSFAYDEEDLILNDVSFTIEKNQIVGLTGNAGSGKATLLSILGGNYKSFKGNIFINNLPIQNYKLEDFRKQIGYYHSMQDIFEGTVWENISMNRPNVQLEKVINIAKELGIINVLKSLPNGLETSIDPIGKKLSSSVVKKILLLRAFANEPSLLLLEHPWSGLEKSEMESIKSYILSKKHHSTVLIVTKDKDFISSCDQLITLK
jgi:ABC-type bacteriocin/lantibiotic exporter with double-glycine peptidase domain